MSEKIWLLLLGFVLTTVFGGVIGYWFKQRSWQVETEHALHRARYDEGVRFLDALSDQVGRRYFLLQRYLWAIEESDREKILNRENEYFTSVVEWNASFWRNRNKIRLLVNEHQANLFLDYADDRAGDRPTSLHYKFAAAHRAVLKAKTSPDLRQAAKEHVEELNWKASVFLERLTTEFVQRATRLQLLQIPEGPGAAEQAAPADAAGTPRR